MIENRKSYRLPFRTKLVYGTNQRVGTGNAINISAGGIFIFTLETLPRETECRCLFQLEHGSSPLSISGIVRRVVAPSEDPETSPGIGISFERSGPRELEQIQNFMINNRKNFEMAAAILAGGEPDLVSLQPLLSQMHLPPFADLGELRFYVERILKSIELIDRKNT